MAAHRARRSKSLVQLAVTIAEADLAEIASCGYLEVKSDDKVRSAEALGLFISDTVACLDTRGDSATQRGSRPLLRRHSSSGK